MVELVVHFSDVFLLFGFFCLQRLLAQLRLNLVVVVSDLLLILLSLQRKGEHDVHNVIHV